MSRWTILVLLALALAIWGAFRSSNPLHTELPFGSTDLSSVQAELERLDPEDRKRVEAYVQRTNGDYLPAGMGDPDDPMTARTFAEAIDLQKRFEVLMQEQEAKASAFRAAREQNFAPLRKIMSMQVVARDMLTQAEIYGLSTPAMPGQPKSPLPSNANDPPKAVTTYRLTNISDRTIAKFGVLIELRQKQHDPLDFGIVASCWVDEVQTLAPGDTFNARCGRTMSLNRVTDAEYLAMPLSDLEIRWEPKRFEFADGGSLEFRE
ncbi:hypothetical protein [Ahniella affigens]|nr:hypothetical protein [Ahniella affigens]